MKNCKHIFKRGKKKGQICNKEIPASSNFCSLHQNQNQSQTTPDKDKTDKVNQNLIVKIANQSKRVTAEELLKEKIMNLNTSYDNKIIILKHWTNLKRLDLHSVEYYKNQVFIDLALLYPWNNYFNIHNFLEKSSISVKHFLLLLKSRLDNEIYGMENVKNEILNIVCKMITNPNGTRNNIALHGVAGVGKSKFIKVLSDTLELSMKTIPLGGVKDSSFFLGHNYVYVESGPGKIIQNVLDSRICNPILYFDELDKISETDNGKDIYSFLMYLTDPTQNKEFTEHYFYGMKFDLSKVFFVFTFNDISKIDKILLDRLNVIKVESPSNDEIYTILQKHCIPEIIENIGINKKITISNEKLQYLVNFYDQIIDKNISSGVREYYRAIEKIFLEINKDIQLEVDFIDIHAEEIVITDKLFEHYFNKIKPKIDSDNSYINFMYL